MAKIVDGVTSSNEGPPTYLRPSNASKDYTKLCGIMNSGWLSTMPVSTQGAGEDIVPQYDSSSHPIFNGMAQITPGGISFSV